jgi:hypothetical protein
MPNMKSDFHVVKFYYKFWVSALNFFVLFVSRQKGQWNTKDQSQSREKTKIKKEIKVVIALIFWSPSHGFARFILYRVISCHSICLATAQSCIRQKDSENI